MTEDITFEEFAKVELRSERSRGDIHEGRLCGACFFLEGGVGYNESTIDEFGHILKKKQ